MLGVLVVAVSLGLSNLAAAVGIGLTGLGPGTRRRVAWVFGTSEAVMPLVGLAIGRGVAGDLGSATRGLGAALLIAIGAWTVIRGLQADPRRPPASDRLGRLALTGLALSVDNLIVGFAIASFDVPILVTAAVIGVVSLAMSLVGLELGSRLGAGTRTRGEVLGGVVLIGVGVAVAAGYLG